jgi:hypothetical protein
MTVMAGLETAEPAYAAVYRDAAYGLPLPEGAPELADCAWCGKTDRASLMYHAGALELYCIDPAQCQARWEERHAEAVAERHARTQALAIAAEAAAATDDPGLEADEPAAEAV